jgi:glutamine amidotransferase
MGWNRLRFQRPSVLLEGLSESDYFYFAHTFAVTEASASVAASCEYGAHFTAVLERDNIYATQFHPEKSAAAGSRLLKNFVSLST